MADIIKMGTTLIEEGTLMLASLQFENEPWTSFYMAGEIIRESRKASGKQSQYASKGNTAQLDEVIDHYNHPCNADSPPKDNPNLGTDLVGAPECGHVMELQMNIKSETQVVEETEFGCGSAIASSSLPAEWVTNKTSRRHWPSRTRISSATRYSGIGGRLHLVGSPIY